MLAIALCASFFLLTPASRPCAQEDRPGPHAASSGKSEEIPDWMARWELARVLSYTKRYDESVAEYKKLLKEKPDLLKAKIEMAKVLFWQGKKNDALAALETIEQDRIDDESRLIMADLYVARKSYGKAEPLYRAYLRKHPGDHRARLKLAELLSWEKRYEESLAEYRTILAALPDDIQVRRKYAFVLIWSGKKNEGAAELRKTLK